MFALLWAPDVVHSFTDWLALRVCEHRVRLASATPAAVADRAIYTLPCLTHLRLN